jgi:DNA helicase-4
MIFISILFLIALVFFVTKSIETRKNRVILEYLKNFEKDFNIAVVDFKAMEESKWYISDRQYRQWKIKYAKLAEIVDQDWLLKESKDPFKAVIVDFFNYYNNGRKLFIDKFNENFIEKESPVIKSILDNKGIQNNDDQVRAIASDEDNTLLVAGAGTGKTTTILGKLAYLFERVNIQPQDILLLSFTGRAVDELSSRISQKFDGVDFKVQTFHSFGLSIIGKALGKKPELAFSSMHERKLFLNEKFELFLKDLSYLKLAVDYFAYYFKPVVLEPGFRNLDDYYNYVKTEEFITLKKEIVKSQQEVMIANFLYLNGVEYLYENPYVHSTADRDYKQYKPDFYLKEYDIYLEHFGINKDGETKYTDNVTQNLIHSEKYRQQMDWKRKLHAQHNTRLIETYSYEFTERNWQDKLTEKLNAYGVQFIPLDMNEMFLSLADSVSIKNITELFSTFLDLSKSNGYDLTRLSEKISSRAVPREQAFFDLFSPIFESYENHLKETGDIDFHDMLIKAADFIREGKFKIDLKYIIIDEFQDFSMSKYFLIKALCEKNPEVKLFCVGDDWQSIFRFAGSDISLMTEFEESYGFTKKNQLVITNRFNDSLALITNNFILKNSQQIKKEVRANKPSTSEAVEILSNKRFGDTEHLLREILSTLDHEASIEGKIATVFILGRYKHNRPENLFKIQRDYINLSVEFLTIHASKGVEADFVIIVDVKSGKYGFPSGVSDDPILDIVLSKGETYPHAEERRLMYVAMTRARHKVFIMTEDRNESVFVLELKGSFHADEHLVRCEECGGEMVKRKGKYGIFYGCTNFPECKHIEKIKK